MYKKKKKRMFTRKKKIKKKEIHAHIIKNGTTKLLLFMMPLNQHPHF